MDHDTLIKRLMATFLEELAEHVTALNEDLLALEKNPSSEERAERLKTLFRTAHSLKGAARSVNVSVIESACHQLEGLLASARDGRMALRPELFALLFQTADGIEEAGMRLREQQDLSGGPLAALLPRLEATAQGEATALAESTPREGEAPAEPSRCGSAGASPSLQTPPVRQEPRPPEGSFRSAGHGKSEPAPSAGKRTPDAEVSRAVEPTPPTKPTPPITPVEAPPEPTGATATVRVAAEKLDTFLARNGELLVARRRVQSRVEDLGTLREFVVRWKAEWRSAEKPLAELLRANEGASSGRLPRRAAAALGKVGEHLKQLEKDLERLAAAMAGDGRILKEAAGAVDEEVRRVRMLPFAEACSGLDRMVRDLARTAGKEVELIIEGGDVELDRSVLEGLKDPLRHLVRNAIDHGAEPPEERRAAGKPARMRLTVAAVLRGATVEVVVADDGRGLDLDGLRQQLRRRQLPESADERELTQAVFLPGLSTAPLITDVSGRGVGLDVVKSRVEALHGAVDLSFTPKRGTRFTLAVPLTLTTLRVLLVASAGHTFALVGATVQKLVRVDPNQVRSMEGREMLALGGVPIPLVSLAATLGLPGREAARPGVRFPAVIVGVGERRAAFLVDEFVAEQEVVIKGLGPRVRRLRFVSAATILPSGRIAPVLNSANLLRAALRQTPAAALTAVLDPKTVKARKRILVADDSVTTRTLEKSILEAAGYEVMVAADGAAAWQLLQERGADLLVSDVEMPRMDGFALTEAVRASKRFQELPVVLVTARESEQDRARGVAVRADAYLGKSGFDQKNLLETVAQLL